jgi:hypothetical protein
MIWDRFHDPVKFRQASLQAVENRVPKDFCSIALARMFGLQIMAFARDGHGVQAAFSGVVR